ncbi:MAG: right-handed parallel beta-helix repeat-containing protein [Candidatus Micrarchaeia archaeon]
MNRLNAIYRVALMLIILSGTTTAVHTPTSINSGCNLSINASGTNYNLSGGSCKAYNITYLSGVANTNLYCNDVELSNASNILLTRGNYNDRIYTCSFNNPTIRLGASSSLDIIGSNSPSFKPIFSGANSNITVGYFLTVNVYEPKGFNSTKEWGDRLTHYSYILPTINNTMPINNTQLQMATSFSPYILGIIQQLKKRVPFGIYNETNSTIYLSQNPIYTSYGTIYGSKTYTLPSYTINATSTTYYSPYNVEYSFFAYDQLIMFKVNMTSNINITPLYIQPIYPPFNFRYIPNAPGGKFTIKWLLSIPPQDMNWSFNYHIYRYNSMQGFSINPFNTSIGPYASFVDLLTFPPAGYTPEPSQSKTYIFNYTSKLGLGLNSSITIANGTADGGKVSYIQDSTTPSFSQGIGYCSSIFNETQPSNIVNQSGYYTMVSGALRPLGGPALPILYTAPCAIGTYIRGDNITIICNGSLINDTSMGVEIYNSKNINMLYCKIKGNGIYIQNSTNVTISNTRIMPGLANSTGIYVDSSNNIKFVNIGVYNGFTVPFDEINSNSIAFYNLSSTNTSTINYIQNLTTVYGSFVLSNQSVPSSSGPAAQPTSSTSFTQRDYLYLGALAILAVYIYLFFKVQYKPSKEGRGRKSKRRTKSVGAAVHRSKHARAAVRRLR